MIARPALRYYGGKWNLARWIIKYFPPHFHYIELCGGAASVLLQKRCSDLETFNDLDGAVVNFFRILRDNSEDLIRKIELTPWSREEYEKHCEKTDDPVERARRFYVGCMQAIGCLPCTSSGWRVTKSKGDSPGKASSKLSFEHLYQVADRFSDVQIEQLPCLELIERYNFEDNLFYFDPPYVRETRKNPNYYHLDWVDKDHEDTSLLLRETDAHVVISGYACDLYCELYEKHGWKRFDKKASTNSGGSRVESLWLSPLTYEVFERSKMQMSMFCEEG